jgi:Fur family iron response transcriptional regulator
MSANPREIETDTAAQYLSRQAVEDCLRARGIAPTRQRIDIAHCLLCVHQHLSAEQLQARLLEAAREVPSRATVYNTLRLLADRGLLREVVVDPQRVFFDSNVGPHHHYFDAERSELFDIPASALVITGLPPLPPGTECAEIDVVVRIRRRSARD